MQDTNNDVELPQPEEGNIQFAVSHLQVLIDRSLENFLHEELGTQPGEAGVGHETPDTPDPYHIPLTDFIQEFGVGLLESAQRSNPPVYDGIPKPERVAVLDQLKRKPFPAQADAIHAITSLLLDQNERAAILNGEMGTGKTLCGIAAAAVLSKAGYRRTLVLSPPHLVYKWRREILETVPGTKVWILNGPDTLMKLIQLKRALNVPAQGQEFYVMGRVRMRMGFHWRPVIWARRARGRTMRGVILAHCPHCGEKLKDFDGKPILAAKFEETENRKKCEKCKSPLWTLMRPTQLSGSSQKDAVRKALNRIPTIGAKTADKLISFFGADRLATMLADNVHEFLNLNDEKGDFIFSDRQHNRMERAMSTLEFGLGEGGYQPSEYIKRYLPDGYFDLLIADEAHEYKNGDSAQGQAMGVLAAKARKTLLLTGTLMGGYATDLFYLLFRALPGRMLEDGYRPSKQGSMTGAAMQFMRDHGVLKDIYTEKERGSFKTARGKRETVRTVKAPGFGPQGILRCVLPYTVFLKLKDIGDDVLPPYTEHFREIQMREDQAGHYRRLSGILTDLLNKALAMHDTTLLGVVLNVLLAWPECCFRPESVRHPRSKELLAHCPPVFGGLEPTPKEQELTQIVSAQKLRGRRCLVYSIYSGKRDTTSRLKNLFQQEGIKAAVLRSNVSPEERENWIAEQVDRGVDVVISNPELVKTGLDLLDFPTIVFMQSGYNVFTLLQAARRSWRIGQTEPVEVYFLGYAATAQIGCLGLMGKKIAVSQSTSGEMPECGLDVLNQDGDSVEMELAKQLIAA
jgi:SNF2 family DNA or RNA helicase